MDVAVPVILVLAVPHLFWAVGLVIERIYGGDVSPAERRAMSRPFYFCLAVVALLVAFQFVPGASLEGTEENWYVFPAFFSAFTILVYVLYIAAERYAFSGYFWVWILPVFLLVLGPRRTTQRIADNHAAREAAPAEREQLRRFLRSHEILTTIFVILVLFSVWSVFYASHAMEMQVLKQVDTGETETQSTSPL